MGAGANELIVRLTKRGICAFSGLIVPWLTFAAPTWLSLSSIGPCWAVLWLLPWALEEGQFSAVIAGLCLGLVLDGISLDGTSQIPILMALGFWWGHFGKRGGQIERSLNLGLLAWIGTAAFGLSLWIQIVIMQPQGDLTYAWGLKTLLSQSIITSLLAPMVCSWLLLFWRKSNLS